jgi:hypothetical protein
MDWLGGARRLTFLDGFPRPRPSYLPFKMASGGVLIGEHGRSKGMVLEHAPLRGRYAPKGDLLI